MVRSSWVRLSKARPCRRLNCQSSTRWIWNHLRASPYQLHFLLGRNKVKVGGEVQLPTSFLGYPVAQSDQWKIHKHVPLESHFENSGPPSKFKLPAELVAQRWFLLLLWVAQSKKVTSASTTGGRLLQAHSVHPVHWSHIAMKRSVRGIWCIHISIYSI